MNSSCNVNQVGYQSTVTQGTGWVSNTIYNNTAPTVPISWLKFQAIANEAESFENLGIGVFCNGNYFVNGIETDVTQLKMYRKSSFYSDAVGPYEIKKSISSSYYTFVYDGITNGNILFKPSTNSFTATNYVSFAQNNQNMLIAANCAICNEQINSTLGIPLSLFE